MKSANRTILVAGVGTSPGLPCGGFFFSLLFLFRFSPQTAILNSIRLASIVSLLMTCLTLNAQTIQGKVVRVSDGDTITILDEMKKKKIGLWRGKNPFNPAETIPP